MKIKGRGRVTKKICQFIAKKQRTAFINLLYTGKLMNYISYQKNSNIDFNILSISSKADFAEQCLSILSFISNIGIPPNWTLVSDGSHTNIDIELISIYFPFVTIIKWDTILNRNKSYVEIYQEYIKTSPMGKKIYILSNILIEKNTLYTDSDILFYKKMNEYIPLLNSTQNLYYLPDNDWATLDEQIMKLKIREMYQLNGGFLLLNKNIEWYYGLEYLKTLEGNYSYFSEQTSCHITFHKHKAIPFDPRHFLLITTDHFRFFNGTDKNKAAIRHFVSPLRHKMWQFGWRWHLK